MILDGATGVVKQTLAPDALRQCNAYAEGELHIPNYVHQRLMIANLSGNAHPQDFVVKVGVNLLAFNHKLELLWQYTDEWFRYPKHSAYIPAVGDFNGDGLDEVNGGKFRGSQPMVRCFGITFLATTWTPYWFPNGMTGIGRSSPAVDRWLTLKDTQSSHSVLRLCHMVKKFGVANYYQMRLKTLWLSATTDITPT